MLTQSIKVSYFDRVKIIKFYNSIKSIDVFNKVILK